MRLKIIDLDGGDQPMPSDDGDTVIAFNGEIYNHRGDSARELEALGHRFHSHCDTEIVLTAFLAVGHRLFRAHCAACSPRRSGPNPAGRLVLARDRMGIKPLYYCRRGDDLYFGSELKAILRAPRNRARA